MNVELLDNCPENAITVMCHVCGRMPDSVAWAHMADRDAMQIRVSCHGETGIQHIPMLEVITTPNLLVFAPDYETH